LSEIENRSTGAIDPRRLTAMVSSRTARRDGGQSGKAAYSRLKSTGQRLEGKGLQEIRSGERLLPTPPAAGYRRARQREMRDRGRSGEWRRRLAWRVAITGGAE
jgi:hypothetical protein